MAKTRAQTRTGKTYPYGSSFLTPQNVRRVADVLAMASSSRNATTTGTATARKRAITKALPRGKLVPRKSKRLKVINSKLPKGVTKKFHKKVQKSVNFTKNWGKYTSNHYVQLRQTIVDAAATYFVDDRGYPFYYGGPHDILHMTSTLFNQKTDSDNILELTGNLDDRMKYNIKSYYVNMFFKSTSSHVVNIDIYECAVKKSFTEINTTYGPLNYINNSYAEDYNDVFTNLSNPSGITCSLNNLNASPKEWVELHKHFNVKRHQIKLQPGDYHSKSFKICGDTVYDLSKMQENSALYWICAPGKFFFFRVHNDPTCSTTTNENPLAGTNAGDVHHWPSNTIGGVACRIVKNMNMSAPPAPSGGINNFLAFNAVRRSEWQNTITDAADQQVVFQNPLTTTSGV